MDKQSKALLVGVYLQKDDQELCLEHLKELQNLAESFGIVESKIEAIFLRKFEASTYLTKGKLAELKQNLGSLDLVIFDDEILPSQQRNLEKELAVKVIDRTELILEVFAAHAQTKEAKIQIELAKVNYLFPRLKRLWTHLERQAGGGSGGMFLKGMGEKQIEVDKRLLKQRRRSLELELKEVRAHRKTQRSERVRRNIPSFAIIGYTNVGKSTLLNALTDAGVLAEDKLFATLDTSTRKFLLPNQQEILLVDTVGFIRKIPHTLVEAFKSTLEEAIETDILLHLIDLSHPMALEQAQSTMEVLKELGAEDKPIITVLNKYDVCQDLSLIDRFRVMYPRTVKISALEKQGFDELFHLMMDELAKRRQEVTLRIPQSRYDIVSQMMQSANILYQDFEENDVVMRVEVPKERLSKLEEFIQH